MQTFLSDREFGHQPKYGNKNNLHKNLYSSVQCVKSWNPTKTSDQTHHGGIFNFDFSNDGSLLVAACERKSVLVFDPFNGNLLTSKNNAHTDCVNCVRFLDSRTFATCSDDTTVCLWDTRYLKQPFRTLRGHSNWVKNIEYARNQGILVTSGFDGSIYTWNINQYSDEGVAYQRVFHTNGLMRSKLTPDASKLVIATAGGYLMVVHNLDLSRLADDLQGFKPNMYRLMQMSQSPIRFLTYLRYVSDSMFTDCLFNLAIFNMSLMHRLLTRWKLETARDRVMYLGHSPAKWFRQGYNYNYMFTRKHNRVEFISDFPARDEAEMIASLEIHPQGWCVVSRNISSNENSEWTCVHDIQDYSDEEVANDPPWTRNQQAASSSSNLHVPSVDMDSPPPHPDNVQRLLQSQLQSGPLDSHARSTSQTGSTNSVATSTSNPSEIVTPSYVISISGAGSDVENNEQGLSVRHPRILITNSEGEASTSSGGASRTRQSFELFYGGSSQHVGIGHNLADSMSQGDVNEEDANEEDGNDETGSDTVAVASNSEGHGTESDENASTQTGLTSSRVGNSVTFIIRSGSQERTLLLMGQNRKRTNPASSGIKINKNRPRLSHFVEEPNVGRGFIKEVCFSHDGRLICSPFGYGVRLLSFDPDCTELCDNVPSKPMQLYELTSNMSHSNIVVTTKFSPTHNLLVSGCLNGKVDFHQPIL